MSSKFDLKSACLVFLAICAAVAVGNSVSGVPYQLESHRIGVCDVQVVLDQIPQGKLLTAEFNALKNRMEKDLLEREKAIRRLDQEAQQLQPGSEGRREVEKKIALSNAEAIWLREDFEKEFAASFKTRRDSLVKIVRDAIEEVAKERELDLVVNNVARGADFKVYVSVWAKPELDITVDVISRVSAKAGGR
ncbi:MAG TPA: OmpH family outer membrane protein [Planctomycetes bacterium]|nr:OmpH family outer membrane protein [Planctomycetota bacterium]